MRFLSEKMYAHSDGYYIYICGTCGRRAIVNHERNIYICKHCKGDSSICEVPSAWANALGMNEISAMNIGMKFQLNPYRLEIPEAEYTGVSRKLESVLEAD